MCIALFFYNFALLAASYCESCVPLLHEEAQAQSYPAHSSSGPQCYLSNPHGVNAIHECSELAVPAPPPRDLHLWPALQ